VANIETLFVGVYNFFTHSPKRALEASKLVGTRFLKILLDPLDFYVVAIQMLLE
jgi:hypothetical protein